MEEALRASEWGRACFWKTGGRGGEAGTGSGMEQKPTQAPPAVREPGNQGSGKHFSPGRADRCDSVATLVPFLSHTCLSTLAPPATSRDPRGVRLGALPQRPAHGGHLTHTLDGRTDGRGMDEHRFQTPERPFGPSRTRVRGTGGRRLSRLGPGPPRRTIASPRSRSGPRRSPSSTPRPAPEVEGHGEDASPVDGRDPFQNSPVGRRLAGGF